MTAPKTSLKKRAVGVSPRGDTGNEPSLVEIRLRILESLIPISSKFSINDTSVLLQKAGELENFVLNSNH